MTRVLVVHALSPLHAGTGQSTSAVDLPIARDRATDLPLLPGSSIKGPLRARARVSDPKAYTDVFGPETANASDHSGGLVFSDARLVLLPVRSVAGTFAWVTSPLLMGFLARDARHAGVTIPVPPAPADSGCHVAQGSALLLQVGNARKAVLEDLDLTADATLPADLATALAKLVFPGDEAWQGLLRKRLCLVHDDVMSFLVRHATEVVTRVSIDPATGTAKDGQLWTEENLPSETVLAGLVETQANGKKGDFMAMLGTLVDRPIQLGGKATVGRGRCQLRLAGA